MPALSARHPWKCKCVTAETLTEELLLLVAFLLLRSEGLRRDEQFPPWLIEIRGPSFARSEIRGSNRTVAISGDSHFLVTLAQL